MKHETKQSVKVLLLEVIVYAGLVAGYYFLVLHFLGPGLKHVYEQERRYYATLALGLIDCQGLLLEVITRFLVMWISPRTED
jgi:hypothetical protein